MVPERRAPLTRDIEIRCPDPTCTSEQAGIRIRSLTVITLRCAKCRRMWSVDLSQLPATVRAKLQHAS